MEQSNNKKVISLYKGKSMHLYKKKKIKEISNKESSNFFRKLLKVTLLIAVIVIFIGAIIYLMPIMKEISTKEGQMMFKEKIDALGISGILLLFVLQLAQIVLVILPGEPIEVLAGMCYGTVGGTIFICASVFITTTFIYFLVKKYGKKLLYQSFKKEKIDKIENSKAFKNPKTIETVLIILFAIPGTPKDLLTYIGGLLPINYVKFVLICTFARFPSVISSTIAGDSIVQGKIGMVAWAYGITFLLTAIMIIIINKSNRTKETKDVLKILK